MVLHWRNRLIVAGGLIGLAGPALTAAAMVYDLKGLIGSTGLALMIVGVSLIMTGAVLRVSGSIGDIYRRGFEDGLAVGRKEGRKAGRPVVIDFERARHERRESSSDRGRHARTP